MNSAGLSAMMSANPSPSLIDDAEFLSELEQIEHRLDAADVALPASQATFDDLDDGLSDDQAPSEPQRIFERDADSAANDALAATEMFDDAIASAAPTSRRDIAVVVFGFVVMMAIGAAGAAFVFQDRLALLFR
jgi:hypothetical protein